MKKIPYYIKRFIERKNVARLNVAGLSTSGKIKIAGSYFYYHHAKALYDTYQEIFVRQIYAFKTNNPTPYIIDCGANMGLSTLYFAKQYPNCIIDAYEPEPPIYTTLTQNVQSYKLSNVTTHCKAVWNEETTLLFYTDSGMGGSIANAYPNQTPTKVQTEILANKLNEKVDFLKMDIEGAEYEVLKSCAEKLHNVENIFVEYHSFINKEQHLEDILQILKKAGFRYHLTQSFSYARPFTDTYLACENMDMAINIYGYRNKEVT